MKENFLISLGESSEKFEISDKGQAPSEEKTGSKISMICLFYDIMQYCPDKRFAQNRFRYGTRVARIVVYSVLTIIIM
jgi:hypothetical protein